jgi:RNA recognition motif-containing protein
MDHSLLGPTDTAISDKTSSNSVNLFVGGILPEITESQLYNYFRKFGDVTRVEISQTSKGKSKRFGYVLITPRIEISSLLKMEHKISEVTIRVETALEMDQVIQQQLSKCERKIFVTGPTLKNASSSAVQESLRKYAEVDKVKMIRTDKKKFACCFITLAKHADVKYLLEQKSLVLEDFGTLVFHRFLPRCIRGQGLPSEDSNFTHDLHESTSELVEGGTDANTSKIAFPTIAIRKGLNLPNFANINYQRPNSSLSSLPSGQRNICTPLPFVLSGVGRPFDPNIRLNLAKPFQSNQLLRP